ncbi:MAG: hypothetical protein ACOYLB_08090 [Phototrophicaceae bacterium]
MLTTLKNKLSPNTARLGYFAVTLIALVYHALILSGVVPYKYAWGGRLQSAEQMIQFESVSIALLLIFSAIVFAHWKLAEKVVVKRITTVLLYVLSVVFLLNTVGNLLAVSLLEAILFTPLTFLSALFLLRLALVD